MVSYVIAVTITGGMCINIDYFLITLLIFWNNDFPGELVINGLQLVRTLENVVVNGMLIDTNVNRHGACTLIMTILSHWPAPIIIPMNC